MKQFIALLKKELNYYFNNPLGYIALILFATLVNFLFVKDLFLRANSSTRPFFDLMPWAGLVFMVAVSMRVFAEENRINTIEILLTLPISETKIVAAKFVALVIYSIIALILTLSVPIGLLTISQISYSEVIVSYLGVIYLLAGFISVTMFFSSQTKNQVGAFLASALLLFLLLVISNDFFAGVVPDFIRSNLGYFSPIYHYQSFLKGLIELKSMIYFNSLILLFLILTIINLEKRQ